MYNIFMELAFIFIFGAILYGIITVTSMANNNTRRKCHEIGVRHVWVVKDTGENTYLVCQKCHYLPNGETEESGNGEYDI